MLNVAGCKTLIIMIGNFTIVNLEADKMLICISLLCNLAVVTGLFLFVYLSAKMNERLRSNMYRVVASLVVFGFSKSAVADFLAGLFSNFNQIVDYIYLFFTKRWLLSICTLALLTFLAVYPDVVRWCNGNSNHKSDAAGLHKNFFFSSGNETSYSFHARPFFHFIS